MIPYVHPYVEVRSRLGALAKAMNAGDHGPVLMGPWGRPQAVLVSFELFDHMRDLLGELEVTRAVPYLRERITHPAGAVTTTMNAISPTSTSDQPVRVWPDVVADLRTAASTHLDQALEAIASGHLDGEPLADERLPGQWRWFLATVNGDGTAAPAAAHYVIWQHRNDHAEMVAVLSAGQPVARAWQAAPDPDRDAVGSPALNDP